LDNSGAERAAACGQFELAVVVENARARVFGVIGVVLAGEMFWKRKKFRSSVALVVQLRLHVLEQSLGRRLVALELQIALRAAVLDEIGAHEIRVAPQVGRKVPLAMRRHSVGAQRRRLVAGHPAGRRLPQPLVVDRRRQQAALSVAARQTAGASGACCAPRSRPCLAAS
jgi:hypothetical protein